MTARDLAWLAGTALLLLGLLVLAGEALVQASLPLLQTVMEWLVPDLKVLRFELDREKADRVLRTWVTLGRYTFIGGQLIEPDPRGAAQASTLALQGLHGSFLALWLAFSWPARSLALRVLRLLASLPLAALLFVFDAPVVLAASLWQFLVEAYAPGSWPPLLVARDLLQGGGRLALGLVVGAGCAVMLPGKRSRRAGR